MGKLLQKSFVGIAFSLPMLETNAPCDRKKPLSGFSCFAEFFQKALLQISVLTILSLLSLNSVAQQWKIVGNENQISSVSSAYTSLTVLDNVPYLIYRENTGPVVKVKKKNPVSGDWEQVGDNIGSNLTYTRIYLDKASKLFVSYVDASSGNRLAVKTFNDSTQLWQPLNGDMANLYVSSGSVTNNVSQYSSTPRSSLAFDSDNNPYIAFGDNGTLTPYVKKFDGNSWVTVGSVSVNPTSKAVAVSLVIDESDIPWLVFSSLSAVTSSTGSMALYKYSSGVWTPVVVNIGGIRHTSMALNSANNLTIAYFNTGNSNRATIIVYNKTAGTWSTTTSLSSRDAPNISLIRDISGNLYCSFIDAISSSFASVARVFKQSAGASNWVEMKDPAVTRGIDEPVGNLTIADGDEFPFVAFTRTNSNGVSTPVVRAYTPPAALAQITTKAISGITPTSAVAGGDITSDGGSAITERGVVFNTSGNPTTSHTKVAADSAGTGSFTVNVSGLNSATLYYLRAYAVNAGGVTYGNTIRLNTLAAPDEVVTTPRQMEFLNRGVVALRKSSNQVYISWRLLGTDPSGIAFNVYRDSLKLNGAPITTSTNFVDTTTVNGNYTVKAVINGAEGSASAPASVWSNNQLSIPLQIPPAGTLPDGRTYTYTANDASVGDVDGDGEYEIFLRWAPTIENHNSGGYSGKQIFDCYRLDGTRLWRIDLGINMNAGPHFNPFMVYDFDGDGKAEIILKTADGTIDGTGKVLGDANVDYRNSAGWVQQGPEWLTVFNGLTGAAMATTDYQPARGAVSDWGDNYGNRQDRFVSAVAYLDGARPSIIVGRGYYDKLVRAAYDWRDGQLSLRWIFDSKDPSDPANNAYSSQGNHQMTIGDVDGDGKDEVINGSSAINDNGKRLWTYGQGHGDALHMSDMDPDRPGLEIWQCLESPSQYSPHGLRLLDAKTGETIFGVPTTGDVGRALAGDVDPNHRGYEMWSSSGALYNVQDGQIGTARPTGGSQAVNHAVWWDGDFGREVLDGTIMDKWNPNTKSLNRLFTIYQAAPVSSNNDSKKNPALTADILGDWREEIILRRSDNTALILFTTNIPTEHRIYTLMHDSQYRTAIAWQNSGYNQPPHPSFFLGYDMAAAPTPNIEVKYLEAPVVTSMSKGTRADGCDAVVNYAAEATGFPAPQHTYSFSGATTGSGSGTGSGNVFNKGITNVSVTAYNSSDTLNYNFTVTVIDSISPVLTVPSGGVLCYSETGYTIQPATATDNCGIAEATYSITGATVRSGTGLDASGTFNQGTSTIVWTVRDDQNHQVSDSITVFVNAPLTASIPDVYAVQQTVDNPNTLYIGYGPTSLTLNATPAGGTAPYTYLWNTGETLASISVNTAGSYTVTITDAKGCTVSASIAIKVVDVTCGPKGDKVLVCHKGSTVCVASNSVQSHLDHGDTLGGCSTGANTLAVADAELKPIFSIQAVAIYPNPSNGNFKVNLSSAENGKVTIAVYNSAGTLVKSTSDIKNGTFEKEMNLQGLAAGVYLIKVSLNNFTETRSVIIN
ncbi:T9SS type A sorting domain-containing protein [Paradesertivirga mongoliensis]|uniref:T9SS type A sorting domain-containing protein n=1 Tax=Paradesertivirga mongoliensis TaxID=2100740 RepID=A0ABW4ZRL6_9SPHI|nr:T9SS type A sorting domain-containing protein [Pedobacter mongoliensis]